MKKAAFKVSPAVIWISSIFLGLLSSAPQLADRHFNPAEAGVNAGITSAFALLIGKYLI